MPLLSHKLVLALLCTSLATSSSRAAEISSEPLRKAVANEGSKSLFEVIPADKSGVDFIHPIDVNHPLKRLYVSALGCGGVAVGDIDGDDRPDLFVVNGPGRNRLFRQSDDFQFEDITNSAAVDGGSSWGGGCAMVDVDNDGDLDLYVCNYETPNLLYLNDGKGNFKEQGRAFGLDLTGAWLMSAFADYDRDGDLDLYLLGHRHFRATGRPAQPPTIRKNGKFVVLPEFEKYYGLLPRGGKLDLNEIGVTDRLLRNDSQPDGSIRFTDVSEDAGLTPDPDQGNSVMWFDYNHDGWPDIYVANDFEFPDRLYRNNQNGTFTEVTKERLPHTTWFSMGTDCADINGDGLVDFLSLDMSGTTHYKSKTTMGVMGASTWFMQNAIPPQYMRNCLYLNTGTSRFLETAFQSGVAKSDWSWAARFGDFDNDARVDLFISNGMTRNFNDSDKPLDEKQLVGKTEWDFYEDSSPLEEQNLAFRNAGDHRFEKASKAWGLDDVGMSYAAALADLDRDGNLDLVVANLEKPISIYRNTGNPGQSRITLKLVGTKSNHFGIGAEVEVETAEGKQIRQFNPMRGFSSCDEPRLHVGLGKARVVKRLTVRWPSGIEQSFTDLKADRSYTITEAGSAEDPSGARPREIARTLFAPLDATRGIRHWEAPYDDFKSQPLLPNSLSQFGPGLAVDDFDQNGYEDLFVGGCAGYLGQLLFNYGNGRYYARDFTEAIPARGSEDLGALFFDANGDNTSDLFVVSGSTEVSPGHSTLADRLYLNDGPAAIRKRGFRASSSTDLPKLADSGSSVTAADFDRDGDLDLFVGGRVVPGSYPMAPASRLLVNDNGSFKDATQQLAPELQSLGMVTGSLWSDANNDGWTDLLITCEWGPVHYFQNEEGTLVNKTEAAMLADLTGWWNGLSGGDFDHDGDIDYVVTNFGLNTKYHASTENPEILYYGDLDGTGKKRLVEAGFEDGRCLPHRGFSCSKNAMPFLGPKMQTFDKFARATLPELYTPTRLDAAQKFEANTLESGVLLNQGDGTFSFLPLPAIAQVSPSFGSAVTDCDADGHLDIYLVQNFFGPQVETRPMDTGLSVLLRGKGDGTFTTVWPRESGLLVPGDAKSLVITDLNADTRPDFVVGVNDGELLAFENRAETNRHLAVKLQGLPGNGKAIGARVSLLDGNQLVQSQEVHAGSGYLSQSTTTLFFGLGSSDQKKFSVEVRWPNGTKERHEVVRGDKPAVIALKR